MLFAIDPRLTSPVFEQHARMWGVQVLQVRKDQPMWEDPNDPGQRSDARWDLAIQVQG